MPSDTMRVGLGQATHISDDFLRFAKQLGIRDVQINAYDGSRDLPGSTHWEFLDLLMLRKAVEDAGLRLAAIENVPVRFYDQIMLGGPQREAQIEHMATTIRNIGAAGIRIFGYHWMPSLVWRTSYGTPGRGGAKVTSFDLDLVRNAPLTHGRVFSEDELWANYAAYLDVILPVAEEAGVRLALHPDDPPVESLGGVPRLFRSFEAFRRAMALRPSPNHGLNLCIGTWSEMGENILEVIRYFRGEKIFYAHFRDVQDTVPKFQECFVGEGNQNLPELVRALREVGFAGFMLDDHVPLMDGDTEWGHRGRAHAVGYMQALLEVL